MKPAEIFAQVVDEACRCGCSLTEPAGHEKDADLARRGFLCNAIAGTAVLAGATVIRAQPASAQSVSTPEAALKALLDGNQRYVGGQLQALDEDLSILKAKTVEKQEPFAAILSCSDSRVPVEFVFDQSIGQLFVVRVAGNVTTPEIMARNQGCAAENQCRQDLEEGIVRRGGAQGEGADLIGPRLADRVYRRSASPSPAHTTGEMRDGPTQR